MKRKKQQIGDSDNGTPVHLFPSVTENSTKREKIETVPLGVTLSSLCTPEHFNFK
jgi:hypothetical protein